MVSVVGSMCGRIVHRGMFHVARPTFESAHRHACQWSTRREGSAARLSEEIPAESYGRPVSLRCPLRVYMTVGALHTYRSLLKKSPVIGNQLNHIRLLVTPWLHTHKYTRYHTLMLTTLVRMLRIILSSCHACCHPLASPSAEL